MQSTSFAVKKLISFGIWFTLGALAWAGSRLFPDWVRLPSGLTLLRLLALLAWTLATADAVTLITHRVLLHRHKPPVEGQMVGRLYRLVATLAVIMLVAYGAGRLSAFGEFFTLFGGMILGWSLQAPVSGFAAWALVSLKRPFRPGDRVQFPNLGLTGDIQDVGLMYTVLNQVGGSIGSEEAVGRYILVPNAMLFSQVAINYTVLQEAPYMLDEVIVRITYDSDWAAAEKILIEAATDVTRDVIEATGEKPYIRSDLYDYGVYLRLRYKTRVKNRAETAYEINKRIFSAIQRTPSIDLAIPYIYSYRAGADRKEETSAQERELRKIQQVPVERIRAGRQIDDPKDVEQLAHSIAAHGLLQPIVVAENPRDGSYDILAGDLRFAACKHLGWKTIPAVVRSASRDDPLANPLPNAGH